MLLCNFRLRQVVSDCTLFSYIGIYPKVLCLGSLPYIWNGMIGERVGVWLPYHSTRILCGALRGQGFFKTKNTFAVCSHGLQCDKPSRAYSANITSAGWKAQILALQVILSVLKDTEWASLIDFDTLDLNFGKRHAVPSGTRRRCFTFRTTDQCY